MTTGIAAVNFDHKNRLGNFQVGVMGLVQTLVGQWSPVTGHWFKESTTF